MADYFTNFSVVLPLTKKQQEYAVELANQADRHRCDDEPLPKTFPESLADETEGWTFETDAGSDGLWLHSQSGGQESACAFIQHLLQKYEFAPAVAFSTVVWITRSIVCVTGGGAWFIKDTVTMPVAADATKDTRRARRIN